ncbi:hypothetical protein ACQV2C_07770 [Pantoea allii]|uniref:hypothetical protein n=1 Tax=Pantoea allii TaxID=574096 RepID=UPI003D310F72
MATVTHSQLTGANLHECKGAATATAGQVPVATGNGTAVFQQLPYSAIANTPITPSTVFNSTTVGVTPKILHFIATAVSGNWSVAVSGITTLHGVQATCISNTSGPANAFKATVNTATTVTITGQVVNANGSTLGTGQTVYVTVYGI